jgi:hypothetical protein
MQDFSIYAITHKLAVPAIKTRTDKRSVFTIENGAGGVPYTFTNELYTVAIPNPDYTEWDPEMGPNPHIEFNRRQIGWHQKLDRSIVPHFSSRAAAIRFLIEEWGYANVNHARDKNRHIKEHFESFEVPLVPRKGYDPTPLKTCPKRMKSTLKMYNQRDMYEGMGTQGTFGLLRCRMKKIQHDERMARQQEASAARYHGVLASGLLYTGGRI